MPVYAIRFDFPESDTPLFAGEYKGAMGFAPTLRTAYLYMNADVAKRNLDNGYGPEAKRWGRVITVKAGEPQ